MKIAISGGSGFVGQALTDHFTQQGHHVYILTRDPTNKPLKDNVTYVEWLSKRHKQDQLPEIDAFINLAGETINGRWTKQKREKILSSRINATRSICSLIALQQNKPAVLINASAIDFYGTSMEQVFTERTNQVGKGFLATVTEQWEREASIVKDLGVRVVCTRFGLILDENKGALPLLMLPYKFFVGGAIGSGSQWYSWIHIKDAVNLIDFAIHNEAIEGALNATSPQPVHMEDFGKMLGSVLNRPHWLPLPGIILRFVLGDMSSLILEGQYVMPQKALYCGYQFAYPSLSSALSAIYAP